MRYLLDHGANPDARDRDGFTSLHSAILQGNAEILDMLLSRGGPIEARNIAETPLILATCMAYCSCMKALLRYNADPNRVTSGFFSPLFVAVINDSIECVEVLLKAGADVNKTPLLELAFDSGEMFDYLLEAGADPNKPNDYGRLPIEIAAEMAQSKKRLERLKWKAESALSRKDYMVSIFLFSYAMMEDPNDATIHANSSLCWLQFGDGKHAFGGMEYDKAFMAFLKGLSLDPTNRDIEKALKHWNKKLTTHN
ncbi:ankyrin repeat family protein [Rhynchospora pubera]|uniref:Ankyrin repeat family protein n=1 Tax=Rhynchospora pubera TaxID=906938 RepID=A0AAV8GZM3_9POAL|nr:ankyrin repeat family protein [Rhynchospora pubera]